jgi:hypothetical protein
VLAVPEHSRVQVNLFYDNPMVAKITFPGSIANRSLDQLPLLSEMSSKNSLDLSIIRALMKMTGTEIQLLVTEPDVNCIFIHIPIRSMPMKEFADVL